METSTGLTEKGDRQRLIPQAEADANPVESTTTTTTSEQQGASLSAENPAALQNKPVRRRVNNPQLNDQRQLMVSNFS